LPKNIYLCRKNLNTAIMVRQIFTPKEGNLTIPFEIPKEWYGKQVEFIAFPLDLEDPQETDLWDNLPIEAKQDIEQGITEIAKGESVEYEPLMARYR